MTLLELRTLVRQEADQVNSQFITDSELNSYINASYGELYDVLVSRFEDYFIYMDPSTGLPPTFTLSGSTYMYPVPANMYKLRGLDYQNNGVSDWIELTKFNFAERNSRSRASNRIMLGVDRKSYRILGANIVVLPEGNASGTYRIFYIPRFTPLVLDADQMSDVLDFEEYVIVDAAMKCLAKEESDVSIMLNRKAALLKRVEAMASNRDSGQPERVADVSLNVDDFDYTFSR